MKNDKNNGTHKFTLRMRCGFTTLNFNTNFAVERIKNMREDKPRKYKLETVCGKWDDKMRDVKMWKI